MHPGIHRDASPDRSRRCAPFVPVIFGSAVEFTMRVLEPKRPAPEISGDGPKVTIGQRRGPLPIPRRLTVILGFFAPDTMSRSA